MEGFFLWFAMAIASAFLSLWLAGEKRRSCVWLLWGFVFGPLALLALAGAPRKEG